MLTDRSGFRFVDTCIFAFQHTYNYAVVYIGPGDVLGEVTVHGSVGGNGNGDELRLGEAMDWDKMYRWVSVIKARIIHNTWQRIHMPQTECSKFSVLSNIYDRLYCLRQTLNISVPLLTSYDRFGLMYSSRTNLPPFCSDSNSS